MSTTTKSKISPLIDKKVTIVPIKKNTGLLFMDAKDEATFMTNTTRSFSLPVTKNGTLLNPLTEDEKEYLEDLLKIDLSVHSPEGKAFWASKKGKVHFRKIGKDISTAVVVLNLNDPYDFIKYKVALVNPRVETKWENRDLNDLAEFVIKDVDSEFKEEFGHTEKAAEVAEYLINNKNDYKALYNLMRLYGKSSKVEKYPSKGATTGWLFNELFKSTQSKKETTALHELIKQDPSIYASRVFIDDAIEAGAVTKISGRYELPGGDVIGYSELEVIKFLDNKRNQDIKLRIKTQIEDKQK
jgi:hypothetical protein